MTLAESLRHRLESCPAGPDGCKEFEDVGTDVLEFMFCPPLNKPIRQPRTHSGVDRRDAVFPNRNSEPSNVWGRLHHELNARMILVEFKNYDRQDIGKDEVNQTRNYLTPKMGNLALLVCNKNPARSAQQKRIETFVAESKAILFITVEDLKAMLDAKIRGDDPANLIMDRLEELYLQVG